MTDPGLSAHTNYTPSVFRRVAQIVAVGAVGLSVWSVLAVMAFRFPRIDPSEETDAYYLLASIGGTAALQEHLNQIPVDKPLVLSTPPVLRLLAEYQHACAGQLDQEVFCVEPEPSTTQGEARQLARVANEQGWRSLTVVTHRSHITRSRMLMERCFPGEVRMTAVNAERGTRMWLNGLIYETGAMAKALVLRPC